MPEESSKTPKQSSQPPPKSSQTSATPSPERTIADIYTGALAFETARYGRKLLAADKDLRRYRERMHAASDAQAKRFGADLSHSSAGDPAAEDEMEVFTNSPITHSITNNPAPVVVTPGGWPAWAKTIVCVAGIAALAAVMWMLIHRGDAPTPVPPPVPPPPATPSDLHIKVIPGPRGE